MSRGLRVATVALLLALLSRGVQAAEPKASASFFDSVIQALVSFFGGDEATSDPTDSTGDDPELGPIPLPWG